MGDRWRSTGRTLWRNEVLVGMVDSPEIAAEIVEAMEIRQRVGDRAAEKWGERSPSCPNCPGPTVPHQHMAITRTEFDRIQDQLSRVDPYDSTKGGVTGG